MNRFSSKQESLVSELIVAVLAVVLMLVWSGTGFGEQKSIILPKGTKVEKIGAGHFKFKLPDGQVVETKGLVKSGDDSSTIGELRIYDTAGKLTASGKAGGIKAGKRPAGMGPLRALQADHVMIDSQPILLPATITYEPEELKAQASVTGPQTKQSVEKSNAQIDTHEVVIQLQKCQEDSQKLMDKNETLQQQNNTLKQQVSDLQKKLSDATKPGGSAVKAYCESETVSRNTAGATSVCIPYQCEPVSGLCRTSCSKTGGECAKGYVCDTMYSSCIPIQ